MTNRTLFLAAHADARANVARFGTSYRSAFKCALYGLRAVANGFTGSLVEPKRLWA